MKKHTVAQVMPQQNHEVKKCPCCLQPFTCKANDIANCQCKGIAINTETLNFISKTYKDCLCKHCLLQIGNQHLSTKTR